MARRLRIQYSDAIYHVMARGNGRQDIVQDDADRGRLVACLERVVRRSGWSLYAFVFLTNHLHLVLQTPRPNLAKGMQLFLSSYANGWARRHRHCGHLLQGRYRTELVEDETYLWVLTRYVHLNPVRAGLSATPEAWIWSSCPGYFRRRAPRRPVWPGGAGIAQRPLGDGGRPSVVEDRDRGRRYRDAPGRRSAQPLGIADRGRALSNYPKTLSSPGFYGVYTPFSDSYLVQIGRAEQCARPGDVIFSPEAWLHVSDVCGGTPVDGRHVRLEAVTRPLDRRPVPAPILPPPLEANLRGYVPAAILSRLDADQTGWVAELRR